MNETAPPPPPDPADGMRSSQDWSTAWIAFLILVLLGVAVLAWFVIIDSRPHNGGERSRAVSNAKQVGLALFNFEQDYGSYPDAGTVAEVRKRTGTLLPLDARTSNDYLRQLIAAGNIDTEKSFYARIQGSRRPDNLMDGAHALEKGECGFAYIIGAASLPSRPLIVTPLIPGTDRFDPKPFDGRAVICWTDGATMVEKIDKQGHVPDAAGRNLLDPANPVWNGKPPIIAWPE